MINDTAQAFRETPLLMVPTHNEATTSSRCARRFADLQVPCDILFIDDNSGWRRGPRRTGQPLRRDDDPSSARKLGIGTAHQTGIAWAYRHGYRVLITMDADFSHDPRMCRRFVAAAVTSMSSSDHVTFNRTAFVSGTWCERRSREGRYSAHAPASGMPHDANRRVPALSSRSHPAGAVRVGGVARHRSF